MANNTRDETIKYIFKAEGGESIDAIEKSMEGVIEKSLGTETAFSFVKQHLEEITVAAIALEAALEAIKFGKESVAGAEDVEAILSRVKALAGQAAGAFGDMDAAIEKAAQTVNVSSADSATALAKLVENGLNAKDAIAALIPTLQLAKIANVDVGTAASEVARALSAFSLPATDAQQVVDQLTAASHGAAGGLAEMSSAAVTLAPDAKTLGLEFTDIASILGLLNSKGLETTQSVRGLRTVFQDLQNPTSALRVELLGLGDGSSSFSAAIAALTSGSAPANQALQTLTGPARSLIELLGQAGPDAIAKFNEQLQGTQGIANKTASVLDDNLGGASKRFGLAIANIGEQLAKPVLEPFAQELNKLAGELNEFADSPDFAVIKAEIGDIVKNGVEKLDEAIHNLDWKGFLNDGKNALKEVGDNFNIVADSAAKTAAAIGVIGDFAGVAYHTLGTVVADGAGIAATAVADLTGKTELLDDIIGRAGDSASKHFEKLTQDALALDGASDASAVSSMKAADSINAHGAAAAAAAPKVEQGATATDKYAEAQERFVQAERDTVTELPTMTVQLGQVGTAAEGFAKDLGVAAGALDDMVRKAQSAGTVGLDTLKTAFTTLRIQSQQQLELTALKAAAAFKDIDDGAAQTAAGLADRQNAFLAYARSALAASTQLDDGTRASIQAQLDAKASVLGVTAALADLETQSGKSQAALVSDANRGAAALDKEFDAASKVSGKLSGGDDSIASAAQDAGDNVKDLAGGGGESLQYLDNYIQNTRTGFLQISDAAAKAFDKRLLQDFNGEFDSTGIGFAKVISAIGDAAKQTTDEIAAQRTQLQGMIQNIEQIGPASANNFGGFGRDAGSAEQHMAALATAIQQGNYDAGLLGQQELQPLQQALDAARDRVQALIDKAKEATQQIADLNDQLQDEIDQQNNDQVAIEDRSYEKQKQQIEDLAAQADASGKAQAAEALQRLDQLHQAKLKEIADAASAQRQAQQPTPARLSNNGAGSLPAASGSSGASSGGAGASIPYGVPVALNNGGRTINIVIQGGSAGSASDNADLFESWLQTMTRSKANSI